MADSNTLLMLVGAATPPGRLAAAIDHAAEAARAESPGTVVDILNLADTAIDICDGRSLDAYGEATRRAVARLSGAGAVLIGAPVYRASYPGVLKNLLDIAPVEALQNKPVGILAMGGSPHHYLAVDTQLRAVLGWFGALVAPTSVYVTGGDFKDGRLASDGARADLAALTGTLMTLARTLDPAALGPKPLAARFT
jgi:FMN reductase